MALPYPDIPLDPTAAEEIWLGQKQLMTKLGKTNIIKSYEYNSV